MPRKPRKGYFVAGQFIAEGSEQARERAEGEVLLALEHPADVGRGLEEERLEALAVRDVQPTAERDDRGRAARGERDREVRHASARELRTEILSVAEQIALFSSGGYWNEPAPMSRPTLPSLVDDGDWLERDRGYMSQVPSARAPAT